MSKSRRLLLIGALVTSLLANLVQFLWNHSADSVVDVSAEEMAALRRTVDPVRHHTGHWHVFHVDSPELAILEYGNLIHLRGLLTPLNYDWGRPQRVIYIWEKRRPPELRE